MDDQPTPRDIDVDDDDTEPQTAEELRDVLGDDGPTDEERTGLGDIGEYGDPAATGEVGAETESVSEEGPDRFADGDMGGSRPIHADESASPRVPSS